MKRVHSRRLFPEVLQDLSEARDWYDEQSEGLGTEFLDAFWRTLDVIDKAPLTPKRIGRHGSAAPLRRTHLEGWPFAVLYLFEHDTVIVVAVHHDRRHPKHWRHRVT